MNKSGRVMVVDDEEDIRQVISIYLEKIGYEVITANDGQDGLEKFKAGHVDVVLSDLTMPNMDGLQLLEKIRELDKDVIFVMITGHPSVKSAVDAIKRGAYDYIEKPVQLDDMKIKLGRAFEAKSLKDQLKSSRGFALALLFSIPIWLILGIILAFLLKPWFQGF